MSDTFLDKREVQLPCCLYVQTHILPYPGVKNTYFHFSPRSTKSIQAQIHRSPCRPKSWICVLFHWFREHICMHQKREVKFHVFSFQRLSAPNRNLWNYSLPSTSMFSSVIPLVIYLAPNSNPNTPSMGDSMVYHGS